MHLPHSSSPSASTFSSFFPDGEVIKPVYVKLVGGNFFNTYSKLTANFAACVFHAFFMFLPFLINCPRSWGKTAAAFPWLK